MPKPSRWPRCVTRFGVVPICRALAVHGVQIAPRTYWAHRSAAPSKRALWDATITEILAASTSPTPPANARRSGLYGSLKMWATCPPGHPGGTLHGGTDHARQRLARATRARIAPDELHVADFVPAFQRQGPGPDIPNP